MSTPDCYRFLFENDSAIGTRARAWLARSLCVCSRRLTHELFLLCAYRVCLVPPACRKVHLSIFVRRRIAVCSGKCFEQCSVWHGVYETVIPDGAVLRNYLREWCAHLGRVLVLDRRLLPVCVVAAWSHGGTRLDSGLRSTNAVRRAPNAVGSPETGWSLPTPVVVAA